MMITQTPYERFPRWWTTNGDRKKAVAVVTASANQFESTFRAMRPMRGIRKKASMTSADFDSVYWRSGERRFQQLVHESGQATVDRLQRAKLTRMPSHLRHYQALARNCAPSRDGCTARSLAYWRNKKRSHASCSRRRR